MENNILELSCDFNVICFICSLLQVQPNLYNMPVSIKLSLNMNSNNSLIPRSRIFLQKLLVCCVVEKFSAFYATGRVYYHVIYKPPFVPILSQINPVSVYVFITSLQFSPPKCL